MTKLLLRPHPVDFSPVAILAQGAIFGTIIFLILYFLEPFGLHQLPSALLLRHTLGLGFVTFGSIVLHLWILPHLWPRVFDDTRWLVIYELLFSTYQLLIIGLANTAYLHFSSIVSEPFIQIYPSIQLGTLMVGLVPLVVMVFFDQNRHLRHKLREAQAMSEKLPPPTPAQPEQVAFSNETGKIELQLPISSVLYLQAEGNYVEVYYIDSTKGLSKHLIRNRLKALSTHLPQPPFFACHRSYVVNLQQVRRVLGNARNYELALEHTPQAIPVSRSHGPQLQAQLAQPSQS